jgi:hypothetical protein
MANSNSIITVSSLQIANPILFIISCYWYIGNTDGKRGKATEGGSYSKQCVDGEGKGDVRFLSLQQKWNRRNTYMRF